MPRIAVIPGDGIGREVTPEAVETLQLVSDRLGIALQVDEKPWGADHYLATGETINDAEIQALGSSYDAILAGAFGDPRVPSNVHAREILLGLRFKLDLFINFRPVRLLADRLTPLKGKTPKDIDLVIFRENTEGVYGGVGGVLRKGTPDEIAIQEDVTTRRGVERICRAAFEYARERGANRVTMADKANAMEFVGGIWRRTFAEIAQDYPTIEAEAVYVDMLAMDLVRRPERYQVIVTDNLFGDILSDLGAQLAGGLGLAASGNIHPRRTSLFEPVHGSAPDLVGTGLANPLAAILSTALLLRHLEQVDAAKAVEEAVSSTVVSGDTTSDLGGSLSTKEVGASVRRRLMRILDETSAPC